MAAPDGTGSGNGNGIKAVIELEVMKAAERHWRDCPQNKRIDILELDMKNMNGVVQDLNLTLVGISGQLEKGQSVMRSLKDTTDKLAQHDVDQVERDRGKDQWIIRSVIGFCLGILSVIVGVVLKSYLGA